MDKATNDSRNLNYIAWQDDLAWMEQQSGRKWTSAINKENKRFDAAIKPLSEMVADFKASMEATKKENKSLPFKWKGWEVRGTGFSPDQIW